MTPPRAFTRAELREIDRRAVERFGIPEIVLMENAGRGAAELILAAYGGPAAGPHVIVCGGGNNGGDGFVIARHLALAGVEVELLLACDPARLPAAAMTHFEIVRRMALPAAPFLADADRLANAARLDRAAIVLDALLGTGFAGSVRAPLSHVIDAINGLRSARVVAIDVPSGLDCDTGRPGTPTVRADLTISFVGPKIGFENIEARPYVGELRVTHIGAPCDLAPSAAISRD